MTRAAMDQAPSRAPARSFDPAVRAAILAWFDANGRMLPFRKSAEPYGVLVSETMLQQTQAARAGDAWLRFMDTFPTVASLAAAAPADVLRAWRGLGYNRRALNLWRAAKVIVNSHGGTVPADVAALEALPGVGPYTARAVAAIAFGVAVGAVDTNVRRVLGRVVFGGMAVPARELQALADQAVAKERPAAWTHAVMDVGAAFCHPAQPDCAGCPVERWCRFAAPGPAAPEREDQRVGKPPGRTEPPFPSTSRWLRGRIVDRLRSADPGSWTPIEAPIGDHDDQAVIRALTALARDGLLEVTEPASAGGAWLARLPGA